jgi:hypothetical protein
MTNSNSKKNEQDVTTAAVALSGSAIVPMDGSVVAGWTMQGGVDALTKVSRADIKAGLRERIDKDTDALTEAEAEAQKCSEALSTELQKVQTPPDLFEALDRIAALMIEFHPRAEVQRTDSTGAPTRRIAPDVSNGVFSATASITNGPAVLYTVSKSYPLPEAVRGAAAALEAAQLVAAECRAVLVADRRHLASVDETIDTIEAEMIRGQLATTDSGRAVLDSQQRGVAAALARLDAERNKTRKKAGG